MSGTKCLTPVPGKVAQWLTRGEKTEAERSALTRGLLRTVAEDLTRRAEGRCDVQGPG